MTATPDQRIAINRKYYQRNRYAQTEEGVTDARLYLFEEFYASLSTGDQALVDCKLARWIDIMNAKRPHGGFGIVGAKELFVSLIEFGEGKKVT